MFMERKSTALQPAKTNIGLKFVNFEDLLDRMQEISNSIARRAFEIFESRGRMGGHELDDWLQAEVELLDPLPVSIIESDEAFRFRAEVPDFKPGELEVSVAPRRLILSGKRETVGEKKSGKAIYTERTSRQVFRTLDLPADLDTGKTTATLKEGILELIVPKAFPTRKVPIKGKVA